MVRKTAGDIQGSSGRYRPSSERPPVIAPKKAATKRKPKKMPKALVSIAPTHGAGYAGRL